MKKEGSDLKIMEEMERKKLQDRYIRFDWAIKRLLRQKANFDVLDGFLTVMLNEEIKIVEILESEGNQESADDKFNRVDIKALNSKGEIILVEIQNTRELHYLELHPLRRSPKPSPNISRLAKGMGKSRKSTPSASFISILVSGQTISITAKIISSVYIRVTICVSTRVNVM